MRRRRPPASAAWRRPGCARRRAACAQPPQTPKYGQRGARRPAGASSTRTSCARGRTSAFFRVVAPRRARRGARPRRTRPCRRGCARRRGLRVERLDAEDQVFLLFKRLHASQREGTPASAACRVASSVDAHQRALVLDTALACSAAQSLEAQVQQVGIGDVGLAVVADLAMSPAGKPSQTAAPPCRACPGRPASCATSSSGALLRGWYIASTSIRSTWRVW